MVSAVLFFAHLDEVRWLPAIGLFLYIDLIGYLPGALAHHRSPDKRIPKVYYVLYNVMHSLVTQGLVVLAWIWLFGAEWALLVVPIHLFGDRALFGNFLKPFAPRFEPEAHPAYTAFRARYESGGHSGGHDGADVTADVTAGAATGTAAAGGTAAVH
ncbi:membrane protein [Streptomyces cremeus]